MTFWETIIAGEYVMFALAVLLIAAVWILWARAVSLKRTHTGYEGMLHRLRDYIAEGDIESATNMCSVIDSPGARSVTVGLKMIGNKMDTIKDAMNEAEVHEHPKLERGIIWLKAISIISPLVSVAGTLCGICDRLRDLGSAGSEVDTSMIAASIAPTLVTTIAGIGVGVFAIVAWTSLEGSVDRSKQKLTEVCAGFREILNAPA